MMPVNGTSKGGGTLRSAAEKRADVRDRRPAAGRYREMPEHLIKGMISLSRLAGGRTRLPSGAVANWE